MKIESYVLLWCLFSFSIVYFHIQSLENLEPLSKCCNATIRHFENPDVKDICNKCLKFCKSGGRNVTR